MKPESTAPVLDHGGVPRGLRGMDATKRRALLMSDAVWRNHHENEQRCLGQLQDKHETFLRSRAALEDQVTAEEQRLASLESELLAKLYAARAESDGRLRQLLTDVTRYGKAYEHTVRTLKLARQKRQARARVIADRETSKAPRLSEPPPEKLT